MIPRCAFLSRQLPRLALVCGLSSLLCAAPVDAAPPSALATAIERAAHKVLAETGVPSASIAVISDGRIAFVGAFGDARLSPRLKARKEMLYGIGSISKQFTAAAVLLLAEDGGLKLDDKIARFLPNVPHASEITIRQLLSHTSGYQDYWPQDYVMSGMIEPTSPDKILARWANQPLDFAPGTRWQYSNTNFVIAGMIVEKVSGMPFMRFLRTRLLEPLGLNHVADLEGAPLGSEQPTGYSRYALGPLHPAPRIGANWLFAMGQLAMTAEDLARWDLALIERRLLKPSSYTELTTEMRLSNGAGARYALGLSVAMEDERHLLHHNGEVSGFCAENQVFPEERVAIVVLTNQDATRAHHELATEIKNILFNEVDPTAAKAQARDRNIFLGLQHGTIERALFTDNANNYFTPQAVKDFKESLSRFGAPEEFKQTSQHERGGMLHRVYKVKFASKSLLAWSREMPDGKLEEFLVTAVSKNGK